MERLIEKKELICSDKLIHCKEITRIEPELRYQFAARRRFLTLPGEQYSAAAWRRFLASPETGI